MLEARNTTVAPPGRRSTWLTNTDTSAPPAEHNTMRQMGQANTCDENNSEHHATNCKHHDVDSDHSIARKNRDNVQDKYDEQHGVRKHQDDDSGQFLPRNYQYDNQGGANPQDATPLCGRQQEHPSLLVHRLPRSHSHSGDFFFGFFSLAILIYIY